MERRTERHRQRDGETDRETETETDRRDGEQEREIINQCVAPHVYVLHSNPSELYPAQVKTLSILIESVCTSPRLHVCTSAISWLPTVACLQSVVQSKRDTAVERVSCASDTRSRPGNKWEHFFVLITCFPRFKQLRRIKDSRAADKICVRQPPEINAVESVETHTVYRHTMRDVQSLVSKHHLVPDFDRQRCMARSLRAFINTTHRTIK